MSHHLEAVVVTKCIYQESRGVAVKPCVLTNVNTIKEKPLSTTKDGLNGNLNLSESFPGP
jgi:hypothetical protein